LQEWIHIRGSFSLEGIVCTELLSQHVIINDAVLLLKLHSFSRPCLFDTNWTKYLFDTNWTKYYLTETV